MNKDLTIAYHLGVPSTNVDQLTWSLRKDTDLLSSRGVVIRRPKPTRKLLADQLAALESGDETAQLQDEILDSVLDDEVDAKRLIISDDTFLANHAEVFAGGQFYPDAATRTTELCSLFPDAKCEFFLSIKNLATFIPDVHATLTRVRYTKFVNDLNILETRWTDLIERILEANPDVNITVWCNEDTPFNWSAVLRSVVGVDDSVALTGGLDIINQIISPAGAKRLETYLGANPDFSEGQVKRVLGIFLEKFALEDEIEQEIDLPGWSTDVVEILTENYEAELDNIQNMERVTFIAP